MLSMILTLLGGGLGGLLRFVPEIMKMITAGRDRDHEFKMTQLQLDIDKARAAQGIDLVHAQGLEAQATAQMQAYLEAIKGQGQLTGVGWIDAVNMTVRPFTTYWWMALFTLYKICVIVVAGIEFYAAVQGGGSLEGIGSALTVFSGRIWLEQDAAVLSTIIGFWYVDRAIRRG